MTLYCLEVVLRVQKLFISDWRQRTYIKESTRG